VLEGKRILLIITGGIAAYKSLDLIRRLRDRGAGVRCVLTEAAGHLVAPLAVAALSEDRVYTDLFSLTDAAEIGHIRLSREADLVVVAPATANILAKMAHGIADDLASTTLLATDREILAAPAMNVVMWEHPATSSSVATLRDRGVHFVGPASGDLACGEEGAGRMAEPEEILSAIEVLFAPERPLTGLEVEICHVETAEEMLEACLAALPVDIAVCAAAVVDWRPAVKQEEKLKKTGGEPPELELVENPDVLAALTAVDKRPKLVIGFAAETSDVVANAAAKRERKGCDWIVANDVSSATGTFGGEHNTVHLISAAGVESWPTMGKSEVAKRLVARIAGQLAEGRNQNPN
jgi:phosphopantothenoylcysteine decarboxylase/phosphopantothenate--cysteine ligase